MNETGEKLLHYVAERSDYLVFVGTPLNSPTTWIAVSAINAKYAAVPGIGKVPISAIATVTVAYPNGQILWSNRPDLSPPVGTSALAPSRKPSGHTLKESEIERGSRRVKVTFGPSPSAEPGCYSTTLTNTSAEPLKILWFGAYIQTEESWTLDTVTGNLYSAEEFRTWYGLGNNEWLLPGASACDPNNYGGPSALWAFKVESASGDQFVAAAVAADSIR